MYRVFLVTTARRDSFSEVICHSDDDRDEDDYDDDITDGLRKHFLHPDEHLSLD